MKHLLCLLLSIIFTLPTYGQNTLSVAGFGELAYQKTANGYSVQLADLGTFDFVGTLQPLDLQAKVTTTQLQNFAGYQMIEALELEQMTLKIQPQNLALEGQADTKKKLRRLCEAFNIQAPFIKFVAQITPKTLQFKGELDLSASPAVAEVSKEIGTRFTFQKVVFEAAVGYEKVKPALGVSIHLKIKPTHQDPDLQTSFKLLYNVLDMEILGTGKMQDTWTDPLGISKVVGIKKDAVSLANAVVLMGWIPSSPTPTTIGFGADKARIFNLEYEALAVVSLTQREMALRANRQAMSAKEFVAMLTEGFGLKVPQNLFGDDLQLQKAIILFSPNGATIGEKKIDKGFAYRAGLSFGSVASGDAYFSAVGKDSISLSMNMQGLEKLLEAKINQGKETQLDKALKQAFTTLQIKKVQLQMKAVKNMNLVGGTNCSLVVFGKEINFDIDGAFSPDKIANGILKKIGKIALEHTTKNKKD